jgi:hypothetical protein
MCHVSDEKPALVNQTTRMTVDGLNRDFVVHLAVYQRSRASQALDCYDVLHRHWQFQLTVWTCLARDLLLFTAYPMTSHGE